MLEPHPVDALVDGRDELDERDEGAVEDVERSCASRFGSMRRPFQTVSVLAIACPPGGSIRTSSRAPSRVSPLIRRMKGFHSG